MPHRVILRWVPFALALAVLASLAAWRVFGGPFGGGSGAQEESPRGGESATATPGPQAEAGGVTPTGYAGSYDPGGGVRKGELGRVLRVRVVEEDHPDRGVPDARVNGWRIRRVYPGSGAPPSDNLSDGRAKALADGWATIQRITRGAVYLQVTASGFTMARRVVVPADEADTRIEVALARGLILSGRVSKADGTAAAGVQVKGTQPEQWGWVEDSCEAVTDGQGAFRLSGLFEGPVSLHATLHDADAVWVADATADAGSEKAEIRLPAEPKRRRVRLLVKEADGSPLDSARWDAEDGIFIPYRRSSSHGMLEKGEVTLPADPDVQWVTIESWRPDDHANMWPTIVGPFGSRGGDLEVVMTRGVVLTGTVRDEQGRPMDQVDVFVKPLYQDGDLEREVMHPLMLEFTDSEGKFRFEAVPPGRLDVRATKMNEEAEWRFEGGGRMSAPSAGPVDFIGRARKHVQGAVHDPDGTPAPDARVYALGSDVEEKGWTSVRVDRDGKFSVPYRDPRALRFRAGLPPSGVDDMAASEVTPAWRADPDAFVITVPKGRDLLVRIPNWPALAAGAARIANGPRSYGDRAWVVGGIATFEGIDPRAPLSFYAGPLPDGRVAFSPDLSQSGAEVTLPLVPSRSVRGRARGFPAGARPGDAWADSAAFEADGSLGADGTFLVRGVPPGACRVCVTFWQGERAWAGSASNVGSEGPVEVEVHAMGEATYADWRWARPPP